MDKDLLEAELIKSRYCWYSGRHAVPYSEEPAHIMINERDVETESGSVGVVYDTYCRKDYQDWGLRFHSGDKKDVEKAGIKVCQDCIDAMVKDMDGGKNGK